MRVRFTRPALADLEELNSFLAYRSPQSADRVRRRIKLAIERLCEQPMLGRSTRKEGVRRLVVVPYPYLVFYEIADGEIHILAVRHGARDPLTAPGEA